MRRSHLLVVRSIVGLVGLGGALACERAPEAHPATEALEGYLMALQYGDAERLFVWHIEGTPAGTWCGSESFGALLDRVKQERTPETCQQVRALTAPAQAAPLEDEQALLVQTMRFVCEHPEGHCRDYAERVFRSGLEASPAWRVRLRGHTIERVQPGPEPGTAIAYVDLIYPEPIGTRHETLRLERTPLGWRVADPLPEL